MENAATNSQSEMVTVMVEQRKITAKLIRFYGRVAAGRLGRPLVKTKDIPGSNLDFGASFLVQNRGKFAQNSAKFCQKLAKRDKKWQKGGVFRDRFY